ncbi:MAG: efflux RND transporter periplasmic adaptor subunit [Chlamydiales bacterium]
MTVSETEEKPVENKDNKRKKRRNLALLILLAIFVLIGVVWFFYWLFAGRFYVNTEDAYVHGNEVMLTPQVSAGVNAIYAEETDLVTKGQLLVELDRSDHELFFEEMQEALAYTVRQVVGLFQDVEAKEAEVVLRAAELRQAELDLKHREPLVSTGAVSTEEFETYQTNVVVAEASLVYAEKELEMARSLIEGTTVRTHPLVQESIVSVKEAYLNLIRCHVLAPVTGYIAKRSVQVGDYVNAGDTLLFIVPLDQIWIEANYKETKLRNVRIDQPVEFTSDIYGGGVKFHGKVVGFQPGSGNAFAFLPPENTSGNWIKIIQRVPVRISIDPDEISKHPLLLGLSMHVHVDVHDTSGKMLSKTPTLEPIYTTPIYYKQIEEMELIDPLIDHIIKKNYFPLSETK